MKEVSQKTGILMFFTLFAAYVTFAASWVGGSNLGPQIIQTYFGHEVSPVLSQVVNYTITIARVVANFLAALFLMKLGIKRAGQFALFLLSFSMVAIRSWSALFHGNKRSFIRHLSPHLIISGPLSWRSRLSFLPIK